MACTSESRVSVTVLGLTLFPTIASDLGGRALVIFVPTELITAIEALAMVTEPDEIVTEGVPEIVTEGVFWMLTERLVPTGVTTFTLPETDEMATVPELIVTEGVLPMLTVCPA